MAQSIAAPLTFAVALLLTAQGAHGQGDAAGTASPVEISAEGKEVYEHLCQACHMADAKGAAGAGAFIPGLADNANLADKTFFIRILLDGRGGMPWFSDTLSPKQLAAVATYVRSRFNNYPDPVTEAEVARLAQANAAPSP